MEAFQAWIQEKYRKWSRGQKTEIQFAAYLGISASTWKAWMKGTRSSVRSKPIIHRLVRLYGDEVYDVLGLPSPDNPEQSE